MWLFMTSAVTVLTFLSGSVTVMGKVSRHKPSIYCNVNLVIFSAGVSKRIYVLFCRDQHRERRNVLLPIPSSTIQGTKRPSLQEQGEKQLPPQLAVPPPAGVSAAVQAAATRTCSRPVTPPANPMKNAILPTCNSMSFATSQSNASKGRALQTFLALIQTCSLRGEDGFITSSRPRDVILKKTPKHPVPREEIEMSIYGQISGGGRFRTPGCVRSVNPQSCFQGALRKEHIRVRA